MYLATVNVPGYLPVTDSVEFDTIWEAWAYLSAERTKDLEDPLNDEDLEIDNALDEMQGLMEVDEIGTVYGYTPGYDGVGLAYSVKQKEE